MGKSASKRLLQRVHQVVRAAGQMQAFETAERFTLTVANDPYMPLVIESWPATDPLQGERRRVLVAHYYVVKERHYPDPELEMTDVGYPILLRQTVVGILETPVLWRDPGTQQVMVNVRVKRDIAELLGIWANNLHDQGFAEAASRIIPATRAINALLSPRKEQSKEDEHHQHP